MDWPDRTCIWVDVTTCGRLLHDVSRETPPERTMCGASLRPTVSLKLPVRWSATPPRRDPPSFVSRCALRGQRNGARLLRDATRWLYTEKFGLAAAREPGKSRFHVKLSANTFPDSQCQGTRPSLDACACSWSAGSTPYRQLLARKGCDEKSAARQGRRRITLCKSRPRITDHRCNARSVARSADPSTLPESIPSCVPTTLVGRRRDGSECHPPIGTRERGSERGRVADEPTDDTNREHGRSTDAATPDGGRTSTCA